jgi:monoamine oxidase
LAAPVAPGLFLAGEATWSAHPGTMHGAWFSGERAAARALAGDAPPASALVVGAGLAGLAAARRLRAAGCAVVVLEAGPEPGGRARTDRSLGVPVHVGAAWLHGDVGNPIAERAKASAVGTTPSQWGSGTTFVDGVGRLDAATNARLHAASDAIDAEIEAAAAAAASAPAARALGPLVRSLVDRHATAPTDRLVLECWINGVYENLYAAPVDDLSLVHRAEPFRLPGRDLTLTGGLDVVVADIARDLDVRCGVRVTAVTARGRCWRVDTASGTGYDVDAVIVSAPVGALKAGRIRFDPPLPAAVRTALDHIGAGRIAKVFCTFDDAFWAPQWSFWVAARPRLPLELWVDASVLAGRPVLCGFATRDNAVLVEGLAEADLCALVTRCLQAVPG